MKVEVRVDDRPVLRRRARTVVVGNVGRLQAVEVSVRAGALWVCVYQPDTSDDLAAGAPTVG